jgi:hypothetical protein
MLAQASAICKVAKSDLFPDPRTDPVEHERQRDSQAHEPPKRAASNDGAQAAVQLQAEERESSGERARMRLFNARALAAPGR